MVEDNQDYADFADDSPTGCTGPAPLGLLDISRVAFVVLDSKGRIEHYNRFLAELTGRELADHRGLDWFECFIPTRERDAARTEFEQILASAPVGGNIYPITCTDGSEKQLEWCANPLVDNKGTVSKVLALGIDVTEQQRTATELQQSQARNQSMADATLDPIFGIDERGIILAANPAATSVFGWPVQELVGRNIAAIMPEPFRSEHDRHLKRYCDSGEQLAIGKVRRLVGRRQDDSEFPCEVSISEVEDGTPLRFVGIVRDISERQALAAQLSQAERLAAIGELAAGVAHEINNPITTILNCAQLISDGDDDPSLCEDIQHEAQRIATIVRGMLDFTRPEEQPFQPTRLTDVVESALRLARKRIEKSGIEVLVDVPADLAGVRARSQQIQQILLNLLLNARDALLDTGDQDRRITISARAHAPGMVRVNVIDNGPGIPPAHIDRIFQPFFTTKRSRGGTGLGLAVSTGIAESHHGRLRASCKNGETTMSLDLPVYA